jgi:hypothetical protein
MDGKFHDQLLSAKKIAAIQRDFDVNDTIKGKYCEVHGFANAIVVGTWRE